MSKKNSKLKTVLYHLWNKPKLHRLHKLSTELLLVSIGTILFVSFMLVFLYIGRDVPIAFMRELQLYEHALDEQAAVIQEKLRNIDISKEITKKLKNIKNNLLIQRIRSLKLFLIKR